MRLVASHSAIGVFARLLAAAVLIAVTAVGAPLHAHDIAVGGDIAPKAQCAACVVSASPGLAPAHADFVPCFEAIGLVSSPRSPVAAVSVAIPSGRAPPSV